MLEETALGIVFDLSLAHSGDGGRNLDAVKEALVKFLVASEARVYVSRPDSLRMPRDSGESTFDVITYEEPAGFAISSAFSRAVEVLGEHPDASKFIFLLTDRFRAPFNFHYRKGFMANGIRGYSTKICVFGVGDSASDSLLKDICEEYGARFFSVADISLFPECVKEAVESG